MIEVIPKAPPNEDVIRILEEMLDRAKTGEFNWVGLAATASNGETTTAWAGSRDCRTVTVVGVIEKLKLDFFMRHAHD